MPEPRTRELERLLTDVEWAMARRFPARDLVPMLENLLAVAPSGSDPAHFAKLRLAELLVGNAPWRAARLAREVLAGGDEDRAWGVLGLALTLLGHYRSAARAYRRAIALAPRCGVYEHNLGHLLDAALDRPRDALAYLSQAHRDMPGEPEVASSYAHALLRAGRAEEARSVLTAAVGETARADALIAGWLVDAPLPTNA